jgi:hypothetical protein
MNSVTMMVLISLIIAVVGCDDYEEAVRQAEKRCHMHGLWLQDKAQGVPELERRGWPVQEARYKAQCQEK